MAIPYTMSADWPRLVANEINNAPWQRKNVVTKTAAYTVQQGDDITLCDATSAAFAVTLPPAEKFTGSTFIVTKIDASANAVTVDGDGAETINGGANAPLTVQWESVSLFSYGTGWILV